MIGSCPECKEAIRIPEGALSQIVRCPLCSAEYELEQVFDQLPPMLEIVGSASEGIGIQIESGSDLELANADTSDSSTATPRYQPQKRKQTNAFAEILKVVLGGALAIPIGVLCVWWFAGRAPFGFAEKVSEYAPWIVPEKLRKGDKIDDSDLDLSDDESDDEKRSKAVNAFKQNANRNLDKEPTNHGVLGITKSVEGDGKAKKDQPKDADTKSEIENKQSDPINGKKDKGSKEKPADPSTKEDAKDGQTEPSKVEKKKEENSAQEKDAKSD